MNKGLFITFEGSDGCGKSTQIQLFADYLKSAGVPFIQTREPGGTDISEQIREVILDPKNKAMNARAEALLYAAARAQLVAQVLVPTLESGVSVVCDRFIDSSVAYQGYARGLGDGVRVINEFAIDDVLPDITFFLDLDPAIGLKRASENRGPLDRMEQEKMEFHQAVYQGYKEIAKKNSQRFVVIDASGSIEEIAKEIQEKFEEYAHRR